MNFVSDIQKFSSEQMDNGLRSSDIICGRCSTAFNHIGNRRFRVTIGLNLQRYMEAKTRQDKGQVILSVMDTLTTDMGARFVKRSKRGEFIELSDKLVRQKVGHALRDLAVQKSVNGNILSTTTAEKSSPIAIATTTTTGGGQSKKARRNSKSQQRRVSTVHDDDDNKSSAYIPFQKSVPLHQPNIATLFGDDLLADEIPPQDELLPVSRTEIFPEATVVVSPDSSKSCMPDPSFDKLQYEMDSLDSLLSSYRGNMMTTTVFDGCNSFIDPFAETFNGRQVSLEL